MRPIEHDDESELPSCSDVGHILAVRKIMREEFEPMLFNVVRKLMKPMLIATLQQEIKPLFEGLLRSVVKDEIQRHLNGGTRNDLPKERNLQLKFLDDVSVSDLVQTGTELKGKNNECLKLALVDANENIVTCDPESSAKVEIVLLDDNGGDDDENIMTCGNFERRIITAGDKEKPHFAKSIYIYLKKGVGNLTGLKLGHDKDWTKSCRCRLGAKIAQNLPRTVVQEAWTEPFKVIDKRGKHYEKDVTPSPTSQVWRLREIGRDGKPFKRLKDKNIETVQDFRFWLSVNPKGLQDEILGAGDSRWTTIMAHAQDCIIDDKKMYYHESSTGPLDCVVYDAVGELKGVIEESHFVPLANLSADKKEYAHKLLDSVLEPFAFVQRYKIFFNDEASLLQQFPSRSSDNTDASLNGRENIHGYPTSGPDLSSQCMVPDHEMCDVTGPSEAGDTHADSGLCFGSHSFPTTLLSETHTADADQDDQLLLASVGNWNPFNDTNHLQQHVTETVGGSSTSSTMKAFGENGTPSEDFGSSRSATAADHREITCGGGDGRHNNTPRCSPSRFLEDLEEFIKQYEPQAVSTSTVPNGWKLLVCVLKWWFSISRRLPHHVSRKRKR